jgi:large subunit ribosomal protein L10
MPLTKKQKISLIDEGVKKLKESSVAIFAGFNGVLVEDFKRFKKDLKKANADFKVVKKRLINISLKNSGIQFDAMSQKAQLGAIFAKGDLTSVAAIINKFAKELKKKKKGELEVIGAYDMTEKRLVDAKEFNLIATLPSKEILLAQIAMMLTMPMKKLMFGLNERAKQVTQ